MYHLSILQYTHPEINQVFWFMKFPIVLSIFVHEA